MVCFSPVGYGEKHTISTFVDQTHNLKTAWRRLRGYHLFSYHIKRVAGIVRFNINVTVPPIHPQRKTASTLATH